jgi:mono/diheme cytochrome c family protein
MKHASRNPATSGIRAVSLLLASCGLAAAVGCGANPSAAFRANLVESMIESTKQPLTSDQERQVATILEAMFGTPDAPVALPESGLDAAKLRLAAGPVRSDIVGRKNGLYREHCAHCHGITGDGMGATAAFLNPYPRDYRPGQFKFKSTERGARPTHDDLVRILRNGIPGSSMPSFTLLSDVQLDALAEYVKYLSIRGETEIALTRAFLELDDDAQGKLPETREFLVDETLAAIAGKWRAAAGETIPVPAAPDVSEPEALAASIAKGKELFFGDRANCVKCHGITALGDGVVNDYDDWTKMGVIKLQEGLRSVSDAALLARGRQVLAGDALKPRPIVPRNLRQGIYRGGRRPLDLYYRIHAGINHAPMPAAKGTVAPEDIWHIVNYIKSLPYETETAPPGDRPLAARDRF